MNRKLIEQKIGQIVKKANFSLREDVKNRIRHLWRLEKNKRAKKALSWIIENAKIAKDESLAICQDTGLPIIFIEVGRDIAVDSYLIGIVTKEVASSYRKNYLRSSIVDPLLRGKPSCEGPICHIDFSPGVKGLKVTILPKGFGCENKSQLKMFNPTASWNQIEDFIIDVVKKAGPESCPPFVVGVGIGATSDGALLLAKKALLERIDKPNKDNMLNKLEKQLFKRINSLKIGSMGLGGGSTVLAVKIKKAPTHIAGLPVGVNISCHALRSATISLSHL